ncbi:hypothetical protein GN244_ATG18645 [Phytophthora infestans]|uniref:Uncharacterized protein n=1 Tax=Phytophthora infestans TaxID=4787 RepID=A0A833WJV5_PHYIN|nr:hypothetical protein GN244_ATG18645 [Phytophthora infestans]
MRLRALVRREHTLVWLSGNPPMTENALCSLCKRDLPYTCQSKYDAGGGQVYSTRLHRTGGSDRKNHSHDHSRSQGRRRNSNNRNNNRNNNDRQHSRGGSCDRGNDYNNSSTQAAIWTAHSTGLLRITPKPAARSVMMESKRSINRPTISVRGRGLNVPEDEAQVVVSTIHSCRAAWAPCREFK